MLNTLIVDAWVYATGVWPYLALVCAIIAALFILSWFPPGVTLWILGPALGIVTIALSVLHSDTSSWQKFSAALYREKLSDLYLMAVVTSAVATADAYELAWIIAPKNNYRSSIWVGLFLLNLFFPVCVTIIASKISEWSGEEINLSRTILISPYRNVWGFLFLSVIFGAIFKFNLERAKL